MRTAAAASPHLGVAGRLETPLRRAFFCTHFRGADRPANSGANLAGSQKQAMRLSRRNGVLDSKKPLSFLKRPVETTSSAHAGCFAVLGLLHENGIDESPRLRNGASAAFYRKVHAFPVLNAIRSSDFATVRRIACYAGARQTAFSRSVSLQKRFSQTDFKSQSVCSGFLQLARKAAFRIFSGATADSKNL